MCSPEDSAIGDLDSLFNVVGFVVIQWGQAEQSLDLIISTIYQNLGGEKLAKRLPKMLDTKLNFIQEATANISELNSFEDRLSELKAEFRRLGVIRNDFVHGAIADTKAIDGKFSFVKFDFKKEFHIVRDFEIDGTHVPKLRSDLIKLGRTTTELAHEIWDMSVNNGQRT